MRERPILASFRRRLIRRFPDLVIIPDVAIAARRAVRSILLVGKMPGDALSKQTLSKEEVSKEQWLTQVRTVALDTSSLTSVALAKILFAKWLGGARDYKPMAPDLDAMLGACDAALLIGDPALQVDRTRYFTLDLAEEWVTRTGKSFVFAFWAIRKQALAGRNGAGDRGGLQEVAGSWAVAEKTGSHRAGVGAAPRPYGRVMRVYLTHNIHYYLDPPCLEGLELYYRLAAEIGALPPAPELRFV